MTTDDFRTQLEGNLELVERAVDDLAEATEALFSDQTWETDHRWRLEPNPALDHAVDACERKQHPIVETYRAAQANLARLATERLSELRIVSHRHQPLTELASHLPLLVHPREVEWPVPHWERPFRFTVSHGVLWLANRVMRKRKPFMLITQRLLVINDHRHDLKSIIRLTATYIYAQTWSLTFWLTIAPSVTVELSGDLMAWRARLQGAGITVSLA